MWSPLLFGVLLFVSACDYTIDLSEKEPRYKGLDLTEFVGKPHPWVLHTAEDGSRFEWVSVSLHCDRNDNWSYVDVDVNHFGPDGNPAGGSGIRIEARCSLFGSHNIRFSFPTTGEELTGTGQMDGSGCLVLTMLLPSKETIGLGVPDGAVLPEEVHFPEIMPQGRFKESGCW